MRMLRYFYCHGKLIHHYRKETSMKPVTPLSETLVEDLENPKSHQETVDDIIKSLDALLDSMKKNQSIISYLAENWGELPIWMKITAGLIVFGSLLLVGMLTLSTLIIVTTAVSALLYTLISLGLDNHYATSKHENDTLKSNVRSLGSFLSLMITELNDLRLTLSSEINRLQNVVGTTKIEFENAISKLTDEAGQFKKTNDFLALTVVSLTSQFSENQESIQRFKDNLDHHLNDLKEGKSDFFQALSNILGLEKNLATLKKELDESLKHNETLFKTYDELVKQHQQKLDTSNKSVFSIGVQTEPFPCAKRLLKGIISAANNLKSSKIASQALVI